MKFKIVNLVTVLIILTVFNCLGLAFSAIPYQQCWQFDSDDYNPNLIASDNQVLIIPLLDGSIKTIDKNGEILWKTELSNEQIVYIKILENKILVISKNESETYFLRLLSLESGLTNWINKISLKTIVNNKIEIRLNKIDNKLYLFTHSNILHKINLINGEITEEIISLPKNLNLITSATENIYYYQEENKQLTEFEIRDNKIKTSSANYFETPFILKSYGDYLIITDEFGNLYNYQKSNNKVIWKTKLGAQVAEILQLNDDMYVLANDNFIYKFSIKRGKKFWKRKFLSRIKGEIISFEKQIIILNINESNGQFLDYNGKLLNEIILLENNIFIGKPIIIDDKIILPTKNGIIAYSKNECKKKQG